LIFLINGINIKTYKKDYIGMYPKDL